MNAILFDYIAIALRQGAELMAEADDAHLEGKACKHVAATKSRASNTPSSSKVLACLTGTMGCGACVVLIGQGRALQPMGSGPAPR